MALEIVVITKANSSEASFRMGDSYHGCNIRAKSSS
eukprot:08631.XXX_496708_496815_1 [CDS] Oithona nana genome sequencing.